MHIHMLRSHASPRTQRHARRAARHPCAHRDPARRVPGRALALTAQHVADVAPVSVVGAIGLELGRLELGSGLRLGSMLG